MKKIPLHSISNQYKGSGACVLTTTPNKDPKWLTYLSDKGTYNEFENTLNRVKSQRLGNEHIYIGKASGVVFEISHEIVPI